MDPVLFRHARRQPGRVRAADVGRSKTSGDRADAVSGRGAAVLSRCALARVRFERNGRDEVYVQAFPSTGRRWQVSSAGGHQPLWRADGRDLFFVSDEKKLYAVDVSEKDGIFHDGVPQFLFDMRANVFNTRNSYIPNWDGMRFLVNMLLDADDAYISVVQNWRATVQYTATVPCWRRSARL